MSLLATTCLVVWLVVVGAARLFRGTFFAIFAAIVLGVQSLSIVGVASALESARSLLVGLEVLTAAHYLMLVRPSMRPFAIKALVSWPAHYFVAASLLAMPWSIASALGFSPIAAWLPFALAGVGFLQSFFSREETIDVVVRDGSTGAVVKRHAANEAVRSRRPLEIVQITDPHLGPFMSIDGLARLCARAVERKPDLVLLTGDYLTMESQTDEAHLTRALAPLRAMPGRVFACRGNHDHEAPRLVASALAANGITLLVDEEAVVVTEAGPVQILGADYARTKRRERLEALAAAHPRRDGHLRLWLLHDPGAFANLPEGEADLVLSGHTHGGHLGFLSLGLRATIVSLATSIPDHGLWARGRDRLYVHRGTCHYGFPVRLGVPAERSLLRVHVADDEARG